MIGRVDLKAGMKAAFDGMNFLRNSRVFKNGLEGLKELQETLMMDLG
jgi:hypothetical protein